MPRIDDGELYLEIQGTTENQLKAGLIEARRQLVGVNLKRAYAAQERVEAFHEALMAWEQGKGEEPDEPSGSDLELDEVLGEAWFAAVRGAGFDPSDPEGPAVIGRFGLLEQMPEEPLEPPVVRDLFAAVH